jgi:hypothetical protein
MASRTGPCAQHAAGPGSDESELPYLHLRIVWICLFIRWAYFLMKCQNQKRDILLVGRGARGFDGKDVLSGSISRCGMRPSRPCEPLLQGRINGEMNSLTSQPFFPKLRLTN